MKLAVLEKVYYVGQDNHVAFLTDVVFTSKPEFQKYLDILNQYGTPKLTNWDQEEITVKQMWKFNRQDFAFITHTENGVEHNYRIRMMKANW